MKRTKILIPFLIVAMLLCLAGCGGKAPETELAFPGTRWTMTPEELTEALKLDINGTDVTLQDWPYEDDAAGSGTYRTITVMDYPAFGTDAAVVFSFFDFNGDGEYGLHMVRVFYDTQADMIPIRAALIAEYGDPISDGSSGTNSSHLVKWESPSSAEDVLTGQQMQRFREHLETISDSDLDVPLYVDTLAWIYWCDQEGVAVTGAPGTYHGPNSCVTFTSGYSYLRESFA